MTQANEHVLRIDATTPKITAEQDLSELPQFPVQFGDSLWLVGYGDRKPHVWHLDADHAHAAYRDCVRDPGLSAGPERRKPSALDGRPQLGLPLADRPGDRTADAGRLGGPTPDLGRRSESAVWVGTRQKERVR